VPTYREDRLLARGLALILLSGLLLAGPARDVQAASEPPRIRNPQPAPNTPPDVPPLPPAFFDPTLAVEGQDLKARKVETRLTVQVLVNGQGPYNFIVDSGAQRRRIITRDKLHVLKQGFEALPVFVLAS